MKIAVMGSGNVGGALGQGWAKKGRHIFGVRDKSNPKLAALLLKAAGAAPSRPA